MLQLVRRNEASAMLIALYKSQCTIIIIIIIGMVYDCMLSFTF